MRPSPAVVEAPSGDSLRSHELDAQGAEAQGPEAQDLGAQDLALELDHLGLIVADLETGRSFLQTALGITRWTRTIDDPLLRVSVQFGSMPAGGLTYELIAPFGDDAPIGNALRAGKHILNHLAYLTADLRASGEKLRKAGCYPTAEPLPAVAYGGSRVQFWMSPLRFVIELIEKPGHRHAFLAPEGSR